MTDRDDTYFMKLALEAAEQAAEIQEVPVGAVLVDKGGQDILSVAHNAPVSSHDPSAHAEICALREGAARKKNYRLTGTTLYVTLEPCAMCAGAISFARIGRLVFAASDPKGGAVLHGPKFFGQPTCHHSPDVTHGLLADEAASLLVSFFRARR